MANDIGGVNVTARLQAMNAQGGITMAEWNQFVSDVKQNGVSAEPIDLSNLPPNIKVLVQRLLASLGYSGTVKTGTEVAGPRTAAGPAEVAGPRVVGGPSESGQQPVVVPGAGAHEIAGPGAGASPREVAGPRVLGND